MKIKILSKEKEFEGAVEEKVVTPFGNSAHINVGKKHSGKYLPVVFPTKTDYAWVVFPEASLSQVVKECQEILKNEDSRLKHDELGAVKNIQSKRFSLADIELVVEILKKNPKNNHWVKKIKSTYNLR
jgi:putative transposon-encoded protein